MLLNQSSLVSIIDRQPLGIFRIRIFAFCFLIVLMDGFDSLAIGVAAKAMSASRCLTANHLTSLVSNTSE